MLLPIAGRAPDDVRDSLAAAAALVDRPDLRVGDTPEEAFWLLSHPSLFAQLEQSRAVARIEGPASAALPDTGYYVSRSSGGDHLVMDAGMHGFLNGGHAHADALSLTFSLRGIPLLIDPGTGSYTTDVEARDRFRSSQLHNTVVVDGRSQSSSSGPFHWNTTANGAAEIWRTNPGFDYLEATHDGYAPLEHRRHLLAMHGDLLIVADAVCGTGAHEMQVHWHLDPRWTVQLAGRRATFRTAGERVDLAVSHGTLDRIAGSEDSPLGWHSPDYGRIEPTSTVTASVSGSLPLWVVSVFGLDPMNEVLVVEPLPVWAPAGSLVRAMAVRIARAHSVDIFAIGAAAAPAAVRTSGRTIWRAGGYETDARVLFCRAGEAASRIALVDGSLVRSSDRQALNVELPRETPDLHLDVPRPCGPETMAARVSGPAFGAQVQLAGTELPVAVERRSTARASASRVRRPTR
jgi:hypothetical protein